MAVYVWIYWDHNGRQPWQSAKSYSQFVHFSQILIQTIPSCPRLHASTRQTAKSIRNSLVNGLASTPCNPLCNTHTRCSFGHMRESGGTYESEARRTQHMQHIRTHTPTHIQRSRSKQLGVPTLHQKPTLSSVWLYNEKRKKQKILHFGGKTLKKFISPHISLPRDTLRNNVRPLFYHTPPPPM